MNIELKLTLPGWREPVEGGEFEPRPADWLARCELIRQRAAESGAGEPGGRLIAHLAGLDVRALAEILTRL